MKYSEMDARQKKAFINIKNAANWIIGGLENEMLDNRPDTEEYKAAKNTLSDHDGLVEEIYIEAINTVYMEDGCFFGKGAERILKDIRFCGKEWLMERCDKRVKKLGY